MQARSGHGTGASPGYFPLPQPWFIHKECSALPATIPWAQEQSTPYFCLAALWSNMFILITSILGNIHRLPAFPPLSQHQALDTGTCTAAPLPPLGCALHRRSPGEGGQGCAAQQLCPAPRRRHPSTTGTFTLHLTRGWPFQAGPEPRQPACQLKSGVGGPREAGGE